MSSEDEKLVEIIKALENKFSFEGLADALDEATEELCKKLLLELGIDLNKMPTKILANIIDEFDDLELAMDTQPTTDDMRELLEEVCPEWEKYLKDK